ncbi:MAG: L-threonylcarbamoyladenylate synthase [Chitinophagaceae bacterium]
MAIISNDIVQAKAFLDAGQLVAIPTETVYGLAGNALNPEAVAQIYAIKQRPSHNPLIVHIASIDQLESVARDIPDTAWQLAASCWPGPLTMVLKKQDIVPNAVTANQDTVAVRIPDHPLTLELLQSLDYPLAAPSANPFGYISPTKPEHVAEQLGSKIPMILDGGQCRLGIESTIIGFDGETPVLYRRGAFSMASLEALGVSMNEHKRGEAITPGMLKQHYSPRKRFVVAPNLNELITQHAHQRIGVLGFGPMHFESDVLCYNLSETGDIAEAMYHLFDYMHRLDQADIDIILAAYLPDTDLGHAINDRLNRAAAQ